MFTAPKTMNQRMFFAREQGGQEPASASEILMKRMRKPLNDVSAELIGRISGRPANDPVTRLRALSLFGQITVFHIAQRSALQLLEWEAFEGERAALLTDTIAEQTRVLLEQWHAQRDVSADGPQRSKRGQGAAEKRSAKAKASPPAVKGAGRRNKPAAR